MRRNACAQTNEAGVMNYDVIAYGSVCRDVKLHDLPDLDYRTSGNTDNDAKEKRKDEMATLKDEEDEMASLK
ncbi:hypothetical protein M8J77_020150 [Diaphorina citri]|nr:hypothetical protein M8J77_020150 [Diaphorina citri]